MLISRVFSAMLLSFFSLSASAETAQVDAVVNAFQAKLNIEATHLSHRQHQSQLYFTGAKTKYSVLIMHGLYESPHYLQGVADQFVKKGMNVISILSSGHWDFRANAMAEVRWQNWRQDALEGFAMAKSLGEKVLVVGYSTGGLMAMDLALMGQPQLAGLILFAPALYLTLSTTTISTFGALTGSTASKLCKDPAKIRCEILNSSTANWVNEALKEGLDLAPEAGLQVRAYIYQLAFEHRVQTPLTVYQDSEVGENLSLDLLNIYTTVKVPSFWILDEGDKTVSTPFSKMVARYLPEPKQVLVFDKKSGVKHTNIAKWPQDTYAETPNEYNHQYKEIEKQLSQFLSKLP